MSYVNYGYGMTYQNPYPNYQGQSYYSQPQQQMGVNPNVNMPQMQMQQTQQNFIPMFYINGIIGAKAFTMTSPNSTILLKDSESNMIYEKKSDAEGRCTISAFEMKQVELDNNGLPVNNQNKETNNINYLTKEDLKDIVNKDDFKTLQDNFGERLNKLSATIENLSTKALNARNNNNNNRNYNNNNNRGK